MLYLLGIAYGYLWSSQYMSLDIRITSVHLLYTRIEELQEL